MIRLMIMPLVADFGEILDSRINILNPKTRLAFTRDYRIFTQFSNFHDIAIDSDRAGPIMCRAAPFHLQVVMASEDEEIGADYVPVDGTFDAMSLVSGSDLKRLEVPSDTSSHNKAIMAFIRQLDDNVTVILFWMM